MSERRQVCWVRPLAILVEAMVPAGFTGSQSNSQLHDLRLGADLLLPIALFRMALDTEVIPLLSRLYTPGNESERNSVTLTAHQILCQLVESLCLAHPEIF